MKTAIRGLSVVGNLHDLRSIPRTRRSAKPALPTTAIMELNMARNERDHLMKEHTRLLKRKIQIDRRLIELEKEMDELLDQARKKAAEIRGESRIPIEGRAAEKQGRRGKMVLEY